MTLDLSSLKKAIAQTEEALAFCASDLAKSNPRLAVHLRAAAIQAFEFTYELTVKLLRRHMETIEANPAAVDGWSFNELIRRGWEIGVLDAELVAWKGFRKDRGTTSHAYDEEKALEVYAGIPAFLAEARHFLAEVERRQSAGAGDEP